MEINIVKAIQSISSNFLDGLNILITRFGEEWFFVTMLMIIYWCISYKAAFKFSILYLLSVAVNTVFKLIFNRPRPYMADSSIENKLGASGLSFPSGHSQSIAFISSYAIYNTKKSNVKKSLLNCAITFFSVITVLVMFSRMYLGQHYLTDVLAGALLGVGCFALLNYLYDKFVIKFINKFKFENVMLTFAILTSVIVVTININTLGLSHSLYELIFSLGAMFAGYFLGCYLSIKFLNLTDLSVMQKIVKTIIGLSVVFASYYLLLFIPQTNLAISLIWFGLSIFASFVYPFIFDFVIRKIKNEKHNS